MTRDERQEVSVEDALAKGCLPKKGARILINPGAVDSRIDDAD